jgi:hypothetical protein
MFRGKSNLRKEKSRRRLLYTFISLLAIILAGCGGGAQQNTSPPLIRAGSPDFEKYRQLIKIDDLEADESARPIGDIVMTLRATVRNFTGRPLNALEVHAAVVDLDGKPVKERNVMIIPSRQPELDNNQTMKAQVLLEGISKNDTRANIKMEVTGFSFK